VRESLRLALALLATVGISCGDEVVGGAGLTQGHGAGLVDDERLRAAAADAANWITHGRTHAEQRYSPLGRIHQDNVSRLGLAWSFDFGTKRGLEATPLVVDGVLYTTGTWSTVHAFDARSGERLWSWDPAVPRSIARKLCCDVVNRGVAVYRGRVYVASLDGRLIALDAGTGQPVWQVATTDPDQPYTITGAPRVVAGQIVIGNSGADLGVRGYVSAYAADTGELRWRTFTVPGDPAQGFESEAMTRAARTWSGEWWKSGGGGTVWDSLAYDPALELLYVGTGNGGPWSRALRSPAGGDNLYLSSILALRASDGELVWHYQTTPGDSWDFTATQHMILADLEIDGRARKVLMQAPKNGFFYVLDRATGELLSADPYVEVTWARGVDIGTGRPIESPEVRATERPVLMKPGSLGGHNWQPMSFHPGTGLVYIPAQEVPGLYTVDPEFRFIPGAHNTGLDMRMYRGLPPAGTSAGAASGHLLAWDPVARREVWRAQYGVAGSGGTLATAGNLVFQGTADGRFTAYRASDGELLWESPAGTGIVAAPVTYQVDAVQYVSIMAGWGGSFAVAGGDAAAAAGVAGAGRLLTFALDAGETLPAAPPLQPRIVADIDIAATPEEIATGSDRYHQWCAVCHGVGAVGGGVLPDLRFAQREVHDAFPEIVLGGARESSGMPRFDDVLSTRELGWIQAYVLSRAPR